MQIIQSAQQEFAGQAEEVLVLRVACEMALTKRDVSAALKRLRAVAAAAPTYAAARAALAEANREASSGNVIGGLGAFLQNQVGGRSVVPREGDDPDAVLSRVGAAVDAGDLSTALTEIEILPEGARALLADWVAQVQTRADADAALADLAASLDN